MDFWDAKSGRTADESESVVFAPLRSNPAGVVHAHARHEAALGDDSPTALQNSALKLNVADRQAAWVELDRALAATTDAQAYVNIVSMPRSPDSNFPPRSPMMPNAMHFAVYLYQCERGPFVEDSPNAATPIWEARCIPGNLVGVGRTPQEAQRSLASLLEWTAKEEPIEAWYRDAWSYVEPRDIEAFDRVVGNQQRRPQ